MSAVIYTPHFVQFLDDNGNPLSGGKLYTYAAGTTTLKPTFTTAAGTIENTNPIILDSSGRTTLFINGSYKFVLTDSNDVHIKTTDNITSFTSIGESAEAYFEAFSGDGSTTQFTTSQDLGTDEKQIMVFVNEEIHEHITNGGFDSDTDWTKGTGWSIAAGVATTSGAISTNLSQNSSITLSEGEAHIIKFTITRTGGTITPSVGGNLGTARSATGTYSEVITAGSTQEIAFVASSYNGTIDNVSMLHVSEKGFDILPPSAYTINGKTLTLATAPLEGTNNIQVWAPSLLAASAATAAASAESSAASAAASAAFAVTAGSGVTDTSITSIAIGTGTKVFTVSSGKSFVAGMYLTVTDQADSVNYMQGFVTSYTGTTLTMTIQSVGGSGTISAWNIYPSATYLSFIASQAEAEAGTSSSKLMSPERTAQAIAVLGIPTGSVLPYAGTTAPTGWFLCYGQAVSRTTYADLFTILGTTYGVGDGSTTFNLPDLRGRVVAGQDDMGGSSANRLTGASGGVDGDVLGGSGGEETHTLTIAEMPAHTHNSTNSTGGSSYWINWSSAVGGGDSGIVSTTSTGSGNAHNNVQPTLILNYIIKI